MQQILYPRGRGGVCRSSLSFVKVNIDFDLRWQISRRTEAGLRRESPYPFHLDSLWGGNRSKGVGSASSADDEATFGYSISCKTPTTRCVRAHSRHGARRLERVQHDFFERNCGVLARLRSYLTSFGSHAKTKSGKDHR